jgi:hypothetical protein
MVFSSTDKNFSANLNTEYVLFLIQAKTEWIRTYDKINIPDSFDGSVQEYWDSIFYEWVYEVEEEYENDLNEDSYNKWCNFDEWFKKWFDDIKRWRDFHKLFRTKTDDEYAMDFSKN